MYDIRQQMKMLVRSSTEKTSGKSTNFLHPSHFSWEHSLFLFLDSTLTSHIRNSDCWWLKLKERQADFHFHSSSSRKSASLQSCVNMWKRRRRVFQISKAATRACSRLNLQRNQMNKQSKHSFLVFIILLRTRLGCIRVAVRFSFAAIVRLPVICNFPHSRLSSPP